MLEYENSQTDVIYENKFEDGSEFIPQYTNGFFDSCFCFVDFIIQVNIIAICFLTILT